MTPAAVPDSLGPLLLARFGTPTTDVADHLRPGAGPLVVVSPHLDDAVLSLGATMAHAVHTGVSVRVVTVLAGDPTLDHPADADNIGMGFATVGEAARVRRGEDEQACRLLGVEPVWLPVVDSTDFPRDPEVISPLLEAAIADAGAVLIPGHPLTHPDHELVARLVVARPRTAPLGLYVEQPYAAWRALRPPRRAGAGGNSGDPVGPATRELAPPRGWLRSRTCLPCARRKLFALGAYRSQLAVLRRWPQLRIALYELSAGGEYVGWLRP